MLSANVKPGLVNRYSHKISSWVTALFLTITTLGCSLPGQVTPTPVAETRGPDVTINAPTGGQLLLLDETIIIQSTALDRRGIARVELVINDQLIRVDANAQPDPNTPFIVAQPWVPDTPGTYTIQVRAFNTANVAAESEVVPVTVEAAPPATGDVAAPEQDAGPLSTGDTPPTAALEPEAPPLTPTPMDNADATPGLPPSPTPTSEPTPVPLSTSPVAPTGFELEGRFEDIWRELGGETGSLRSPAGSQIGERKFAKQYFAGGLMFWWDNPAGDNYIWVIDRPADTFQSGSHWERYVDRWDGAEAYSCPAARQNGERGPVRGFGKIWCSEAGVAANLGTPLEAEAGSGGNPPFSLVQFFQGGTMIYNPLNSEVLVLFNDRTWQKFGY